MRRHKRPVLALKRLDTVDGGYPVDAGFCEACSNIPPHALTLTPSFSDLLGEEVTEDDFQREVAAKTQTLLIGRQEAEREVVIDKLIEKNGDREQALMFVVTKFPSEHKVQLFTNMLLQRGANPSTCDSDWQTPLHHAVRRNFKGVCSKLLENDALPHVRDKHNNMPYHIALTNNNDDIAALLLNYMPNIVVRGMYVTTTADKSECSLHKLLHAKMKQTALGVLDCMMDPVGETGRYHVYYEALEADEDGRPPSHQDFNSSSRCCLHLIAKQGLTDIVFHDSVRLLIRRKWKDYIRFRFVANSIIYCITLFCLTFSLAVATLTQDPTEYKDALAIVRGVTEVWTVAAVTFSLVLEVNQMRKHRLDYWKERFNWIDLSATLLLIAVVPLRFTHRLEQWHVFSVGYLLWTLKIFKYAAVFRQTGAYALILVRILGHDFVQFTIFFSVILLAFSGSFVLALRGEESLDLHQESGTFWDTLFTGIRILIENDPIVEYYGINGYKPLSCILMVVFLITCCVVLLNILIAQLSDTYQNIQDDAQRALELNRAWIISRIELNSILIRKSHRLQKYVPSEEVSNLEALLEKWESPPMSDMSKNIRSMWDSVESNKLNLLTIENRLARQDQTLARMQQVLDDIAACCMKLRATDHTQKTKQDTAISRVTIETNQSSENESNTKNNNESSKIYTDIENVLTVQQEQETAHITGLDIDDNQNEDSEKPGDLTLIGKDESNNTGSEHGTEEQRGSDHEQSEDIQTLPEGGKSESVHTSSQSSDIKEPKGEQSQTVQTKPKEQQAEVEKLSAVCHQPSSERKQSETIQTSELSELEPIGNDEQKDFDDNETQASSAENDDIKSISLHL